MVPSVVAAAVVVAVVPSLVVDTVRDLKGAGGNLALGTPDAEVVGATAIGLSVLGVAIGLSVPEVAIGLSVLGVAIGLAIVLEVPEVAIGLAIGLEVPGVTIGLEVLGVAIGLALGIVGTVGESVDATGITILPVVVCIFTTEGVTKF